jgi:hypothetical protein
MELDLETYMESEKLPETARALLREQVKHSVGCYGLNGEDFQHAFDKERLLNLIIGKERFMVDSNSHWKSEAAKPENKHKAFIIGDTVLDEPDDFKGNLFGRKVNWRNNNIFLFGITNPKEVPPYKDAPPYLTIERYDAYLRKIADEEKLKRDSRPREKRTDAEFLAHEAKHMANVSGMKQAIAEKLEMAMRSQFINATSLDNLEERAKSKIIQLIGLSARNCFQNYVIAADVAEFCYAALLLESDDVGEKTWKEFNGTGRNIFGDTRLIQNALWFKSRILSDDRAVGRMAEYIGLPEMTVTGMA